MVTSLNDAMRNYHQLLQQGTLQQAYCGLMEYMLVLRHHFTQKYPKVYPVGHLHHGSMDMSCFPLSPKVLKVKHLKVAVAFNHVECRFEAWLVGKNKYIAHDYWHILKDQNWQDYPISETPDKAIIRTVLVDEPDFDKPDELTASIEQQLLPFMDRVINALK